MLQTSSTKKGNLLRNSILFECTVHVLGYVLTLDERAATIVREGVRMRPLATKRSLVLTAVNRIRERASGQFTAAVVKTNCYTSFAERLPPWQTKQMEYMPARAGEAEPCRGIFSFTLCVNYRVQPTGGFVLSR